MNGRHTHELILDSDFRERVAENSSNPDLLRALLAPYNRAEHDDCIYYVPETGHERAVPVEIRRGHGKKVPVSVSRAVYAAVFGKDLGPDEDVKHTCKEFRDLDGKRRPCVNPSHLTPTSLAS